MIVRIVPLLLLFSACSRMDRQDAESAPATAEIGAATESKIAGLSADTAYSEVPREQRKGVAYFEKALTYQYTKGGITEELWIFVNESNGQLLMAPDDDMIAAVISYPNGEYAIFGTDENGQRRLITQRLQGVAEQEAPLKDKLQPLRQRKIISQKNIQQPDIVCEGYQIAYDKTNEVATIYSTTQIPVNSHQIFGFTRLMGDVQLTLPMDYSKFLSGHQLPTHLQDNYSQMTLLNYGPNPYEFDMSGYAAVGE